MKRWLILFLLLLGGNYVDAQSLTGIWRGFFNSGYGQFRQRYKYEVQINQLGNKSSQKGVQGVTYSYHSTVFYGKADLQGIYDPVGKSITIKETKLVELKISNNSQPCLMTCYLDYRKEGSIEILEGTFTSVVDKSKADCGSGYVYLERVDESDFYKEDFLIKKAPASKPPVVKTNPSTDNAAEKKTTTTSPNSVGKKTTTITSPKNTTAQSSTTKKSTTQAKPPATKSATPSTGSTQKNKPAVTAKTTKPKPDTKPVVKDPVADTVTKIKPATPPVVVKPSTDQLNKKTVPVPDVIKERENALVRKIITASPDIQIELFDNGEIDGDTITVYDNNEIIANSKRLSGKPITLNVKADLYNAHHEFVMVANNLGSIPPNTAMMVITTGGKRYELFISSDEKKNAKVVIEYKPPSKESR